MPTRDGERTGGERPETALAHASELVPCVLPGDLAGEIRARMIGKYFESASHIAVLDHHHLVGIVRIEDLLAAPSETPARDMMDTQPPVVAPGIDQEVAAWRAVGHRESALGVVDADGRFHGLIPPHRLLAVLLAEHDEDLVRMGGFVKSSAAARTASEEPAPRRLRHRLPWLFLGLAASLAAADIVGWFEAQLKGKIMLAFFIPAIVYLADAVGTQTETVVVRGLSVGVRMRRMIRHELLTGLAIGAVLGLVAGPFIYWRWGDCQVALAVALSVFTACASATIAAMVVPWMLERSGFDPAFGSGPLATALQDLSSLVIYFAIAIWILQG